MNVSNTISSKMDNLPQIQPAAEVSLPLTSGSAVSSAGNTAHGVVDTAQLSAAASLAAQSAPDSDVRLDKVASIQGALQAGTYSVPASAVAQKVIGALLEGDQ
jgi:anti-sigma28 factor (negative regulator of flagellin synthesis)